MFRAFLFTYFASFMRSSWPLHASCVRCLSAFLTCTVISTFFLYTQGSVHRNSTSIRSNKMQQYAGIYLRQNHSTCFGCPWHPSSGVHKIVTAASGTGHIVYLCNSLPPKWPLGHVVARILWPVPEAAVTVLCTPDDGCDRHPKHIEWFCSK